jgi:cell division transport system permease protein
LANRPNYLSSILSVALVLLLLGFFALTALYGQRFVTLFKEKVEIWLELRPDLPESEVSRVVALVRSQPFVKRESVTFITREQATATMRQELGDASMLQDLPNLMRDIVRFNVKAEYLAPDSLAAWRTQMQQDSAVSDLAFEAFNTGNADRNLENLGYLSLALAFLLIFAAVTLIHNTIRLALYANRFLIKNQELVGASWAFITRPYLQRAVWNGLLSALIAIGTLLGLLYVATRALPDLAQLHDPSGVTLICLCMLALGIVISLASTWWVVNKFLRLRIEELY